MGIHNIFFYGELTKTMSPNEREGDILFLVRIQLVSALAFASASHDTFLFA